MWPIEGSLSLLVYRRRGLSLIYEDAVRTSNMKQVKHPYMF